MTSQHSIGVWSPLDQFQHIQMWLGKVINFFFKKATNSLCSLSSNVAQMFVTFIPSSWSRRISLISSSLGFSFATLVPPSEPSTYNCYNYILLLHIVIFSGCLLISLNLPHSFLRSKTIHLMISGGYCLHCMDPWASQNCVICWRAINNNESNH